MEGFCSFGPVPVSAATRFMLSKESSVNSGAFMQKS